MTNGNPEMLAQMIIADVVVVGAGPAGIAAATVAAERGLRVVLLDRGLEAGGQIWRHVRGDRVPTVAQRWLARLASSKARIACNVSVVDIVASQTGFRILANSAARAVHVEAASIILATGARELLLPFDGWTLPGVIGVGGAHALLKSGASFAGKRVIVAGSGPLMFPVAAALSAAGATVSLVAEQASRRTVARFAAGLWRTPSMLAQAARYRVRFRSAVYSPGTWVTAAHGAGRLDGVTVTNGRRTWRESAEILCTGYGLVPNVELARIIGCDTWNGSVVVDTLQRTSVANVFAVGEATGIGGAPLSLVEGELAGHLVQSGPPAATRLLRRRAVLQSTARRMLETFALRAELRTLSSGNTVVCRCEDVQLGQLQGLACARQAKLYTRVGMGPCQGRTCMPGLEFLLGWQADTVRPPVEPVPVSVLASEPADGVAPTPFLNFSVTEANQ